MLVETPIGNLKFAAFLGGLPLDPSAGFFRAGNIKTSLPPGMSVTQSVAVLFIAQAPTLLQDLQVRGTWETVLPAEGDPASGERLDAQQWIGAGQIVVVGTEDGDALAERLPGCGFREDPYPVTYFPDGLAVTVPIVASGTTATLHFIVAANAYPEPVECSAWFAADVPHQRVLQALGGS